MIKNIGILVIGLLAGAFLMNVYTNQQNKEINKELPSSEIDAKQLEATSNLSFDDTDTKALLEEVALLKAQLEQGGAPRFDNSKRVVEKVPVSVDANSKELTEGDYNNAMLDLFERLNKPNAEEDRLGSLALDELKRNQIPELKDLFPEDTSQDDPFHTQVENKYKKHLSQEKDNNWAYEAESVLMNYFKSTQNSNFTAYRIDCRTRSCEVAGLITFEKEINPEEPIELALSTRVLSFGRITTNLKKQAFYNRYFSLQNNEIFNPLASPAKVVPYSFFLPRAK